ncbi:MAG TPA: PspA/IM30 family protein [Ktedonobacteraceae bacterium]|jgi:phage shock protein A|nr:PspA/IM30 family protein [Ktedonobacteraceae bacterium]
MNLLERVLTLLRANLNSVVEKADDPEKALRQLQLDMRNQLVQVKTQVATAIAEGHKLRKRIEERNKEADLWLKKAEQAIQHNNDDIARAALTRYNDMQKLVQRYTQQQKEQEQLVTTMRNALSKLEAKISEVDTTIDILATRKRNALIQQRVYEALNKTGAPNEKERTERAQDTILDAEARARALAALEQPDLDAQLTQISQEQFIERQMREIRSRQQSRQEPAQLSERNGLPSSLTSPEPHSNQPAHRRERQKRDSGSSPDEPQTQKEINLDYLKKLLNTPQTEL